MVVIADLQHVLFFLTCRAPYVLFMSGFPFPRLAAWYRESKTASRAYTV